MNKENIDFARLNGYLELAIPGIGLLQSVDKFTGGQSNPTYREVELENVSEKDKQISNLMHNYWVQFAKTGNPNLPGQPKWNPYNQDNGSVLELGDTIALKNNFLNERIKYHINRGTNFLQSMTK